MINKNTRHLKIHRLSFQLGMINCFVEMVACGVKKLALSPPLSPNDYREIEKASNDIVKGFNIKSYLEESLMVTELQDEDFTRGKWAILYFRTDDVLQKYLELKQKQNELKESGKYDRTASKKISREFMRLLSYPDNIIEEKLSKTTPTSPFLLVE